MTHTDLDRAIRAAWRAAVAACYDHTPSDPRHVDKVIYDTLEGHGFVVMPAELTDAQRMNYAYDEKARDNYKRLVAARPRPSREGEPEDLHARIDDLDRKREALEPFKDDVEAWEDLQRRKAAEPPGPPEGEPEEPHPDTDEGWQWARDIEGDIAQLTQRVAAIEAVLEGLRDTVLGHDESLKADVANLAKIFKRLEDDIEPKMADHHDLDEQLAWLRQRVEKLESAKRHTIPADLGERLEALEEDVPDDLESRLERLEENAWGKRTRELEKTPPAAWVTGGPGPAGEGGNPAAGN